MVKNMYTTEDLLLSKVKYEGNCWVWFHAKSPGGYGSFHFRGRQWVAHRVSYTLFVGEIPESLELDHLCKNTSCINPKHLEPVTHLENIRRSDRAKPQNKTHCKWGHELTPENKYMRGKSYDCILCRRTRDKRRRSLKASSVK